MKYKKMVELKNNLICHIRNVECSDAKAVYDIFNLTHGQTDFLLTYPEENSFNLEKERQFLIEKKTVVKKLNFVPFWMVELSELPVLKL